MFRSRAPPHCRHHVYWPGSSGSSSRPAFVPPPSGEADDRLHWASSPAPHSLVERGEVALPEHGRRRAFPAVRLGRCPIDRRRYSLPRRAHQRGQLRLAQAARVDAARESAYIVVACSRWHAGPGQWRPSAPIHQLGALAPPIVRVAETSPPRAAAGVARARRWRKVVRVS